MKYPEDKYKTAREERRQQILTQAKQLFLQRGLADVGMRDIAAACNISRQTLYKYFSGVDAIIFGIQDQIMRRFSMRDEKDLESLLKHLFDYYQKNTEDFFFISMFDVYVHTHQIEEHLLRQYRTTIRQCIPAFRVTDLHSPTIDGVPAEKYVAVAVHAAWALITRMMILGCEFTDEYHITEEESFQILCRALCRDEHPILSGDFKQTVSKKS